MGIQSKRKYSSDKTTHSKRATTSTMRQLSLLLLLSVAMFCSAAMAKYCRRHKDCETTQACQYRRNRGGICADLCSSYNCNKGVNNARDSWRWTPLHEAAIENNVAVAKLLLENSADVDGIDSDGATALHFAARMNSFDVAKVLIAHSANVQHSARYWWGKTALYEAAENNSVDVAKLLIPLCRFNCYCWGKKTEWILEKPDSSSGSRKKRTPRNGGGVEECHSKSMSLPLPLQHHSSLHPEEVHEPLLL